jgi:ABC-type uncharacterized transport system permease subunit
LLPLVLGLIVAASLAPERESLAREGDRGAWGIIHGTSILLAAVFVLVAFAAGLMYLEQTRRLKHKLPPIRGLRLPSLEWLQRTNSRAIVVSMFTLGLGVLSGVVLNRLGSPDRAAGVPWYDPVVLSTHLMFAWLLIAVLVGWFYKPARQGRRVAYFTLVGFVFLAIALTIGLFVDTQHWGGNSQDRQQQSPPTAHSPLTTHHSSFARGGRV